MSQLNIGSSSTVGIEPYKDRLRERIASHSTRHEITGLLHEDQKAFEERFAKALEENGISADAKHFAKDGKGVFTTADSHPERQKIEYILNNDAELREILSDGLVRAARVAPEPLLAKDDVRPWYEADASAYNNWLRGQGYQVRSNGYDSSEISPEALRLSGEQKTNVAASPYAPAGETADRVFTWNREQISRYHVGESTGG